jgi:hypothetical protein
VPVRTALAVNTLKAYEYFAKSLTDQFGTRVGCDICDQDIAAPQRKRIAEGSPRVPSISRATQTELRVAGIVTFAHGAANRCQAPRLLRWSRLSRFQPGSYCRCSSTDCSLCYWPRCSIPCCNANKQNVTRSAFASSISGGCASLSFACPFCLQTKRGLRRVHAPSAIPVQK